MMDPNAQGRLLLSFLAERHQRQGRRIAAIQSRPAAWRRILASIGGKLIDIGTQFKAYGQPTYGAAIIDIPLEAR